MKHEVQNFNLFTSIFEIFFDSDFIIYKNSLLNKITNKALMKPNKSHINCSYTYLTIEFLHDESDFHFINQMESFKMSLV